VLFDEGDDPDHTDRVGPPVSEREATAESDKRSRRRPKRTSGAGDVQNGQAEQQRADWAGQGGRRWAAAGLENKGGGRAGTISQAEIK
jgi:hypothetical protein